VTLKPADIRNTALKSGYKHVNIHNGGAFYHAQAYGGKLTRAGHAWWGPQRATALEAAQDYCDYANGNPDVWSATKLKSAGHKRPSRSSQPLPQEVKDALGVLRDYKAQKAGVQGFVYLIIEKLPGGGINYGKIGFSTNPEKRVAELQTGNPRPLQVLYAMPGTEDDERKLHAKYSHNNVLQEWFSVTRELILEFPANTAIKEA
jgi:hypothetical protein